MVYGLLQRRILLDLFKYMVVALAALSVLFMIVGAMAEALKRGIDPLRILKIMPYLIAPTLPYTMPTCLLLACTLVYSNLSRCNEIIAAKAAGIHVMRLVQPVLLVGILLSVTGVYCADVIIPHCNRRATDAILGDLSGVLIGRLQKQGSLVEHNFPYEIYVQAMDGERMIRPIMMHRTATGEYDLIASAATATLEVRRNASDFELVLRMQEAVVSSHNRGRFAAREYEHLTPVPNLGRTADEQMQARTFAGCRRQSALLAERIATRRLSLALDSAQAILKGDPSAIPPAVTVTGALDKIEERQRRQAFADVHVRLAQSLANVAFVLLGCPISILYARRELLQTFFTCFMPVIVAYYPSMILVLNLYKEGTTFVSPLFLWLPTLLLGLASIPFFRRVIRY